MCIILDANYRDKFLNNDPDMQPVHNWIDNRGGKIAYSNTEKITREMVENSERYRKKLRDLSQRDKLKIIDPARVQKKQRTLTGLKSDDPHIIALALAAKVKVLASKDNNLHKDFRKHVKGRIYQNANHKHLLKKDLCP